MQLNLYEILNIKKGNSVWILKNIDTLIKLEITVPSGKRLLQSNVQYVLEYYSICWQTDCT